MSILNQHISIPKKVSSKNDLDYYFLREKGIEYIEQLGGKLWTDFNSHDPGITILEVLSYAITDLGMRIDLPIEHILTSDENGGIHNQFFKASEVLPTSPVTANDYRKLFIDIDGVKNCWLTQHKKEVHADLEKGQLSYKASDVNHLSNNLKDAFTLKGLYDIYIDYEEEVLDNTTNVDTAVKKRFHANRNLCEDIVTVKPIGTYPIKICADIEVETMADEEKIHALILRAIDAYFSPTVNFYSIQQMLEKGYTATEIFDGPILDNGFIDDAELATADLRSEVRLSDIVKLIMSIPGVKHIKEIAMGDCAQDATMLDDWLLCMKAYQKPTLCDKSVFNYNKGVLPLTINKLKVAQYLEEFKEEEEVEKTKASENKTFTLKEGEKYQLTDYTSIQNEFPLTYGIGNEGLIDKPTTARKSQAKQLKAYLLFFDQVLASYFKHLGEVSNLLSVKGNLTQTLFTQAIKDIDGIDELVENYDVNNEVFLTQELFGKQDNDIERRNELLDHLLARFAERFSEYTFIMRAIYGSTTDEMVLRNKEDFLSDYKVTSKDRGNAANFYQQAPEFLWNTNNVSGTQKRIARLLGIKNYNRRSLSQQTNVETYTLINSDSEKVYRWRLRDNEGKIILSATEEYYDLSSANRELYFSISQIIQTSEDKIKKVFSKPLVFKEELIIDNILIHQSESGKYSYDIINPAIKSEHNPDRIIAKRFNYYPTQEELETSILGLIQFLKDDFSEEGLFLVEHIMLRPDVTENNHPPKTFLPIKREECKKCEPIDPYSYRVSIVIPGYTFRFMNTDFRNYMEKIIKETLPSHILPKICWIGYRANEIENQEENDLLQFEEAYKAYLLAKTNLEQIQPEEELIKFIQKLTQLSNVYPTGRLFDCSDDDNESLSGNIILGKTNLGSL
ncbi:conserved protein of unknown function [Tenacibaculum sp. 190524A02b]|uniref:hypothetical protein n=1 Tax=Tenacibaculum vairaonense TaxID=3137860 RepID=UPI0032B29F3C